MNTYIVLSTAVDFGEPDLASYMQASRKKEASRLGLEFEAKTDHEVPAIINGTVGLNTLIFCL